MDMLVSPADVFRRRANESPWPPLLVVWVTMALVVLGTYRIAMQPIVDAEFTRNAARMMQQDPRLTLAMVEGTRQWSERAVEWERVLLTPLIVVLWAGITWLVGRIAGATQSFNAAVVVAAYAFLPRVFGAVLNGAQAVLWGSARITSAAALSIGPARLLNPDTANSYLFQLALHLDVITLWTVALLAVGLFTTGGGTRVRAVWCGAAIWLLMSLPALTQGLIQH